MKECLNKYLALNIRGWFYYNLINDPFDFNNILNFNQNLWIKNCKEFDPQISLFNGLNL